MNDVVKSTYQKNVLKIQNIWFANPDDVDELISCGRKEGMDVINIHGISFVERPRNWNEQYTIMTNLSESEEELKKRIRKNFRYEIRRIEKESVVIKRYSSEEFAREKKLLDLFEKTYNQMYRDKGMGTVFNRIQVEQYLRTGCMIVTIGFYDTTPYVFHSYICNKSNARFYYSTSPFRSDRDAAALIGRINKAMHWHDMKMFKEMGIVNYDWGGISDKDASNGIDQFKVGFGGNIEKYYNCSIGVSLKGRTAIKIKDFLLGGRNVFSNKSEQGC